MSRVSVIGLYKTMSGKFSGFSNEEIHKIRSTSGASVKPNKENCNGKHFVKYSYIIMINFGCDLGANTMRRPTVTKAANNKIATKSIPTEPTKTAPTVNLPDLQHISISESDSSSTDNSLRNALHFKPLLVPEYQQTATERKESSAKTVLSPNQGEADLNESGNSPRTALRFVGISLREYEAQRRMVEEQNRHKKEMIYKEIEQRSVHCTMLNNSFQIT